jgi:hypothetical protein
MGFQTWGVMRLTKGDFVYDNPFLHTLWRRISGGGPLLQ